MYYCKSCKKFVESLWRPEGEPQCISCRSLDMEDAYKCPVCGDWSTERYGCGWCREEATVYIKSFLIHTKERKKRMAYLDILRDVALEMYVREEMEEENEV